MTVHLWQSAKNASCPNQQEHTTVVSVTGESKLFFLCTSVIATWFVIGVSGVLLPVYLDCLYVMTTKAKLLR